MEGRWPRLCDSSASRKQLTVSWGQSVHVTCFPSPRPAPHPTPHPAPRQAQHPALVWTHADQPLGLRTDKYVETASHGLVILAVAEQDAGRYDCLLGGRLLCSYNLTVSSARCGAPSHQQDYHKVYADWCHQFNKYKAALRSWEQRQSVSLLCSTIDHLSSIESPYSEDSRGSILQ